MYGFIFFEYVMSAFNHLSLHTSRDLHRHRLQQQLPLLDITNNNTVSKVNILDSRNKYFNTVTKTIS